MPFLLNIRHNVTSVPDHFARGDVHRFEVETVRVGRDVSCECQIDDPLFLPEHLCLHVPEHGQATLSLIGTATAWINDTECSGTVCLTSGDEIRVEHWILRFQKLYPDVGLASRTSLLALGAKILIVCILIAEIGVVSWLPYRMRHASVWHSEIARQRMVSLLDDLRSRTLHPKGIDGPFERSVVGVVAELLDSHARYLRQYQEDMTPEQRQRMWDDLRSLDRIMGRIEQEQVLPPEPAVDVESAVRGLLAASRDKK